MAEETKTKIEKPLQVPQRKPQIPTGGARTIRPKLSRFLPVGRKREGASQKESGTIGKITKKGTLIMGTLIFLPIILLADVVDIFTLAGPVLIVSWILDILSFVFPAVFLLIANKGQGIMKYGMACFAEGIPVVEWGTWRIIVLLMIIFSSKST